MGLPPILMEQKRPANKIWGKNARERFGATLFFPASLAPRKRDYSRSTMGGKTNAFLDERLERTRLRKNNSAVEPYDVAATQLIYHCTEV